MVIYAEKLIFLDSSYYAALEKLTYILQHLMDVEIRWESRWKSRFFMTMWVSKTSSDMKLMLYERKNQLSDPQSNCLCTK